MRFSRIATAWALTLLFGAADARNPHGYPVVSGGGGGGATLQFSYANFSGSPTTINLPGDANYSGSLMEIGNGSGTHQIGGAWYKTIQTISGGFTAYFTFQLPSGLTVPSINGISFALNNTINNGNPFGFCCTTSVLGDANLDGYGAYTGGSGESQYVVTNSIAIAFTMSGQNEQAQDYKNSGSPSTVGLYINGGNLGIFSPEQDMVPYGINLYSGDVFAGTVVYDSSNLTLTLVLQDTSTLAQARYTWPINIPLAIGGNAAYVGFTSGNGPGTTATNSIKSWSFYTGINTRLGTPTFSPAGGSYGSSQTVSINCPTGATCYYTTNGLQPSTASTQYTGSFSVSANEYVQAIAVESNYTDSYVGAANYLISASNTINFGSGFSGASGLIIPTGNAQFNSSVIDLTVAGTSGTAYSVVGAAWYVAPITVSSFSTAFTLEWPASNPSGITFMIQNQNPTSTDSTALMVAGGPFFIGGGYQDAGNGFGYMQPNNTGAAGIAAYGLSTSVAVSLNPADNGIGVYTAGAAPAGSDTTISGVTLSSGHPMLVTLTYSGTTLSATIKDTVTTTTAGPYTFTVNIPSVVGASTGYVGFTSSTNGNSPFTVQEVTNWTM